MSNNLNLPVMTAGQNNKEITNNDQVEAIDAALTEFLTSDFTSGNITLTDAQFRENLVHILDNVATARVFDFTSTDKKLFLVIGATGNSDTCTVTVGSTTVAVVADDVKLLYTDGTTNGLFVLSSGSGALSNIVEDVTPQLGAPLDTNSFSVKWSKGADVASGTALPLLSDGNYVDVTGTTTITSFDTVGVGTVMKLHFDAILILTHNSADLVLPTGANITTAVGDEAEFIEYAAGDWRCTNYTRADGTALAGSGGLSNIVEDTTPQLGGDLDANSNSIFWSKGADVASATELLVLTDGNSFDVTGTTTITSIEETADAFGIGTLILLHFDGILTLTHSAADLFLCNAGANISTAVGDTAIFQKAAAGDWRCISYQRADGTALVGAAAISQYFSTVLFEFTTNTAIGDGAGYMHIPPDLNGMNLTYVHAEVITAGVTGTLDIQVTKVGGSDMLSTKLTIDTTETGSDTAATPAVIDTANDDVATNDFIRIDVDAIHTGTAAIGLVFTAGFELP